jgi:hypothetical protein
VAPRTRPPGEQPRSRDRAGGGRVSASTTTSTASAFAAGALALALAVGAAGCAAPEARHAYMPHWDAFEVYGSKNAVSVIDVPLSVDAYGLEPVAYEPLPARAEDFQETGHRATASPEDTRELSAVLLDAQTFGYDPVYDRHQADPARRWVWKPPCDFVPEAALQFRRGASEVTVVLSFACNVLAIYEDGDFVTRRDFDTARWRLLQPLKRLLRGDRLVQGLE